MSKKHRRNIIAMFFESVYGHLTPEKIEEAAKRQEEYHSFRAKYQAQRLPHEIFADNVTHFFGSLPFVIVQIIFMVVWLAINSGLIPDTKIFDPYPFGMLTSIVTYEALLLTIFILISQHRAQQMNDIRDEVNFQINAEAEHEITRLIRMVNDIHQHLGLAKKIDKELEEMMQKIDPEEIEKEIKAETERMNRERK